jgi:hypothetical protein
VVELPVERLDVGPALASGADFEHPRAAAGRHELARVGLGIAGSEAVEPAPGTAVVDPVLLAVPAQEVEAAACHAEVAWRVARQLGGSI